MSKKILVTSALLYANGPLHIGHLVEYIQTDIFVRFLKLTGKDVIYCCADDTHGAPIQINAEKQGIKPEVMIAKYFKEHTEDFKAFNVKFDNYYTTHSDENKMFADLLFKRAKEKGFIYKKEISQLHCPKDNMFLPDRYVKGTCHKCGAEEQYGDVCEKCGTTYKPTELINPKCSICGTTPTEKSSDHYFFKLSEFSDKLNDWLTKSNLQKEIVNSVKQWITEGLHDWDITRDSPYFGFKIPGEDKLFYYVWWDAPIGYIASNENYCKNNNFEGGALANYWENKNSEIIHIIGKDIIYFHFLFWPAVLMAGDLNLPKKINVHGFLTVNGEKMSKSRGTFITAKDFLKKHDPEQFRFYLATGLGKKLSDLDLNFDEFIAKTNNELVANIGNFCYRALSFTNKNFDSEITNIDNNKKVMDEINQKVEHIKKSYNEINLMEATREIMAISAIGNKYLQDAAPWKLIKEDKEKAREVIGLSINIAKILSIIIEPIMPEFSNKLKNQLNLKKLTWDDINFNLKNHKINKAEILIQKIEKTNDREFPLDLKIAEILEAKAHPKADKLIILQLNLGNEKRQIVAGLKEYYNPEDLVNKKIIVVTNLKPAKLRGEISQGMLLAAQKDNIVKVIMPKNSKPGDQVLPKDYELISKQLKFEQFMKLNKMTIKNQKLVYDNLVLQTDSEEIKIDMPDGSTVR
jgi:methionyl-tRNA synthetase